MEKLVKVCENFPLSELMSLALYLVSDLMNFFHRNKLHTCVIGEIATADLVQKPRQFMFRKLVAFFFFF